VTGDQLKARRHAREVVAEMRWRGMTVPVVYARMADEFEDLVRSGEYTDWVAANQKLALLGRKAHVAGPPRPLQLDRSGAAHAAPRTRRMSNVRAPRRGVLLTGPIAGR
jgi:hypothetical protein